MQDINIVEIIMKTINTLSNNLFSSMDNSIYPVLDKMVFVTPEILETTLIEKILGTTSSNGLLVLANALLVAFVLYYAIRLVFCYYTSTETESPIRFFIRAVLFGILMNSSFFICTQVIGLVSYISSFISDLGYSIFGKDISFLSLINMLNSTLTLDAETYSLFSIDGIIKALVTFGIFNLLLSYSLRYVMIKVIVLLAPFAFLCLINKSTEWFFKSWLKNLLSLLFLQILVSVILLLPHAINIDLQKNPSDLFYKLSLVGAVYALFKANDFIRDFMGGISTTVTSNMSNIKNFFY